MKSKLQLLKDIAEFLNEETDRNTMIDGALRELIDHTDFETGWVFFINQQGTHELISHYRLPPSLEKENNKHLCDGNCWCVTKYNNNELEQATNIFVCSRLEKAKKAFPGENNGITHHATVPLISGEESFGLLNIASPGREQYDKDELDLLESVAFQIGSTLKRLELTAREQENMIIRERQRLARDLHDSVNQMLFSIGITSHAAKGLNDEEKVSDAFNSIENTSKHAMNEMKALIWQLKPIGLENGIINAIQNYAELLGIDLDIDVAGFYNVEDEVEISLYRVLQEGLNNIRKHAGSSRADIAIISESDHLKVRISDKGAGFEDDKDSQNSYGLDNMRERVRKFGGSLDIESRKGFGTTITVTIPIGE